MNGAMRFAAVSAQAALNRLGHIDVCAAVQAGHDRAGRGDVRWRRSFWLFGFDGFVLSRCPIPLPKPDAQHDH